MCDLAGSLGTESIINVSPRRVVVQVNRAVRELGPAFAFKDYHRS